MTTKTVEATTKSVVTKLSKASASGYVGIREIALAVEEALPGTSIEQIHAAVRSVANFYPSDDPRDSAAARQWGFGWQPGWSSDPMDRRVWVHPI